MKTKTSEIVKESPKTARGLSPWEEMDSAFDSMFHSGWLRPFHELFPEWTMTEKDFGLRMPKVDMVDNENEILVRAELPGVDKKDLEVNLSGQKLTIKGETKQEEKEEKGDYYRSEIRRGTFSRTLQLPVEVEEEKIKAVFENGMLEVRLPKIHKAEKKQIPVE